MAKRPKGKRDREGYDPPLLIYFVKGTRPALRKKHGPKSEARTLRRLVAEHLAK